MTDVVIAGYARSPFTLANKGALARVRPDDLAAQVIRAWLLEPGVVDAVLPSSASRPDFLQGLLFDAAKAVNGRPDASVSDPLVWNPPTIYARTPLLAIGLPLPNGSS